MSRPARNEPCPCGSGKRYKECHGAITGGAEAPRQDDAARPLLDAALAAQQVGRLDDAIEQYEAVIARHPESFDALHMLGVTYYQRGDFDRAWDLVSSASRYRPSDVGARHNLQLIESVLEHRKVERHLCREVLARLAPRCIAPATPGDVCPRQGALPDVIVSTADAHDRGIELDRLIGWLGAQRPTVWIYPELAPPTAEGPFRVIDPAAGIVPRQPTAIFLGAEHSPAEWYEDSAARDVALFCGNDSPCRLLDRIPELAREGRTPIRLLFASPARAQSVGLPGIVVARDAVIS